MSVSFIAKIVFVIAMAFTLSAPLAGNVLACDGEITGHC